MWFNLVSFFTEFLVHFTVKWQTQETLQLKIGFHCIFLEASSHHAVAFELCVGDTVC